MKLPPQILLTYLLLFSLFLFTHCSEEDDFGDFSLNGTNIAMADIAGNWEATKANFSRSAEGPVVEVDIIAEGGYLTMQIQTDGKFSVTYAIPGISPVNSTGRMGFDEDLLVISFDDDPEEFEFFGITHNEPDLSIRGGTVYEAFDFNGDGTEEDADIDFEFVRN